MIWYKPSFKILPHIYVISMWYTNFPRNDSGNLGEKKFRNQKINQYFIFYKY